MTIPPTGTSNQRMWPHPTPASRSRLTATASKGKSVTIVKIDARTAPTVTDGVSSMTLKTSQAEG